jgi:hypothetical protein
MNIFSFNKKQTIINAQLFLQTGNKRVGKNNVIKALFPTSRKQ